MKSYSELSKIFEQLKDYKSPENIAKKHNVPLSLIKQQLKIGNKVEREHTNSKSLANRIASQHLEELPDYYNRLKNIEKNKKVDQKISEQYTRIQTRGSTYTIFLSWRGKPLNIQIFFPQFTRPTKSEVKYEVDKIYPGAIVLTYVPSPKDPTKPFFFAGDTDGPR